MGVEVIERVVRVMAVIMFLILAWLCLGGDTLVAAPTPIASFLVHLVMFFFLGAFSYVGWADSAPRVTLLMVALAVMFEVIQIVQPERTFSMLDLAGNLMGVGLAWVFYKALVSFKRTIRV